MSTETTARMNGSKALATIGKGALLAVDLGVCLALIAALRALQRHLLLPSRNRLPHQSNDVNMTRTEFYKLGKQATSGKQGRDEPRACECPAEAPRPMRKR